MTPQELLGKLKIETVEERDGYGKFVFEPLPIGFGQTLGNSLRRVLLSSLPGAAVTYARIEGVSHQFSTINGVKEDVIDLIQNFKKVRLIIHNNQPVILRLEVNGPKRVVAGDFEVVGSGEIVNKDLEIATLADKKTKLVLELTAEPGYGYTTADEHQTSKIGVIPVDSIFTPIMHVSYKVEQTRLGQITNLDKLILEIKTDKTIDPSRAIKLAADTLIDYLNAVKGERVTTGEPATILKKEDKEPGLSDSDAVVPVEDLGLSTRTANALAKAKIKVLGELATKSPDGLGKIKGLGEKGIGEIMDLLKKYKPE